MLALIMVSHPKKEQSLYPLEQWECNPCVRVVEKRALRHLVSAAEGVPWRQSWLPGDTDSKQTQAALIPPGKPASFDEALPQRSSRYSSVGRPESLDVGVAGFHCLGPARERSVVLVGTGNGVCSEHVCLQAAFPGFLGRW